MPLGFVVDFFGQLYSDAYVNNNGNITFSGPLSTFTPGTIAGGQLPIIAPFWADVDTRGAAILVETGWGDTHWGSEAYFEGLVEMAEGRWKPTHEELQAFLVEHDNIYL